MIDKIVATGDFKGIREGQLVKVRASKPYTSLNEGEIVLVIGKSLIPRTSDPKFFESFDPVVFVISRGRREWLPVDDVEIVSET